MKENKNGSMSSERIMQITGEDFRIRGSIPSIGNPKLDLQEMWEL